MVVEKSPMDSTFPRRPTPGLDDITHLERSENEEHHAGCDIREGSLHSQTHGQSGGGQNGQDRRHLNPDHAQGGDPGNDEDQVIDKAAQKLCQGGIGLGAFHEPIQVPPDTTRYDAPHDDDRDGPKDLKTPSHEDVLGQQEERGELGVEVLHQSSLFGQKDRTVRLDLS